MQNKARSQENLLGEFDSPKFHRENLRCKAWWGGRGRAEEDEVAAAMSRFRGPILVAEPFCRNRRIENKNQVFVKHFDLVYGLSRKDIKG